MNHCFKYFWVFSAAVLLGIIAMGNLIPTASAAESGAADLYVLTYNVPAEGYGASSLPYMYTSPFRMAHFYKDPNTGTSRAYLYLCKLFQLVNPTQPTTVTNPSLAVYRADVGTRINSGSTYRRVNLEDLGDPSGSAASRLRAVILNSFPYVQDVAAIEQAANLWLNANAETAIVNLQIGEAMTATQQAIWSITYGSEYIIVSHHSGFGGYDGSKAVCQINSRERETEHTGDNIEALYHYLMNLKGAAPLRDTVSDSSFENVVYSAAKKDDGTYTITVTCFVNTTVGAGDDLILSAACADQIQTENLLSGGGYAFTFEGVSDLAEVTLEINGYQVGGDVYLFETQDTTQSMIGYDDSRLPVHGEVAASSDRVLNIRMTASGDDEQPLANMEFEVYQVGAMEAVESGTVTPGERPSEMYKQDSPIAVLKTDTRGLAVCNFTENGMPNGVYRIVQRHSPSTTEPVEPFFITLPEKAESGDGETYTIVVDLKNTLEQGPNIQKEITKQDDHSENHEIPTWIIRGGVPAGIGSAVGYEISDTIGCGMTYQKGSPVVMLATGAGEELSLSAGIHYTLAEGTTVVDGCTVDCFRITLTNAGMAYAAQNLGSGDATAEIRVYYKTTIHSDRAKGEQLYSKVRLSYVNLAGVAYDTDSEA